jgi:hypothetical protein
MHVDSWVRGPVALPGTSRALRPVSAGMPVYRAVLAVDVKDFGSVRAADHHRLTEMIPAVLERAFHRAGYGALWAERRFPAGRGDGYVVGFRPEVTAILVGPVVDGLQDELAALRRWWGVGVRMRVGIGVGPLTDSDRFRLGDGSGAAIVEAHRLLDSEPARRALEDSDPEVTFVAVMVSRRVFEDVVVAGYTTKAASEFRGVPVRVKNYREIGFLHVPKPSGRLLATGLPAGGSVG